MAWDRPYWAGFAVAFVSLASVGQSLNKAALAVVRAQMQRLEEMTRALFAAAANVGGFGESAVSADTFINQRLASFRTRTDWRTPVVS